MFLGLDIPHDFGDDFAQYIDQARDVVENTQVHADLTHSESYSPAERGAGFSLVLIPVYASQQLSNMPYLVVISLLLVLSSLAFFLYLNQRIAIKQSPWLCALVALCFAYNFQVLRLKDEIMPEFLYLALLFSSLLLYQSESRGKQLTAFACIGWLTAVKEIGWVFALALIIHWLMNRRTSSLSLGLFGMGLLITLFVHFAINFYVFGHISTSHISWYSRAFEPSEWMAHIQSNLGYYLMQFPQFFEQEIWGWLIQPLVWFCVLLLAIGVGTRVKKPLDLASYYVLLHVFTLLLYENNQSAIRFLIPVFPFLLIYAMYGAAFLGQRPPARFAYFPHVVFLVVLLSNFKQSRQALAAKNDPSPYSVESQALWKDIQRIVPKDKTIAFQKPWALHLFTKRTASYMNASDITASIADYILELKAPDNKVLPSSKYSKPFRFETSDYRLLECE